jgi:L-amino acid N-acyltransferase YncA
MIRDATESDLPAILAITNEVIATSTAIYTDGALTLDERRAWYLARRERDYPVLVEDEGGEAIGYATFGDFRTWPGYRFTVEHSVHIRADRRGQGTGRRLMQALMPIAVKLGKHAMVGGVDGSNQASINFHERLGFQRAATLREVGRKFDRWLDLVFMLRILGP